MIIYNHLITPRRGNEPPVRYNALGDGLIGLLDRYWQIADNH